MSDATTLLADLDKRMSAAVQALKKEFTGLRTGRASTSLLDPVVVDAYGAKMPISQLASVTTPDARTLSIQVWDQGLVKSVEKAIRDASLGLNPMAEGQVIRAHLPELSEDRRKELAKVAAKYAEQARVSVRNVRRDGMDTLKKLEKDNEISEDEFHRFSTKIQTATDEHIKHVDEMLAHKDKEIMTI